MTEEKFQKLAGSGYNRIPIVREILADTETPLSIYLKLGKGGGNAHGNGGGTGEHSYFFESVQGGEKWGRYSIIGLPCSTVLRVVGETVTVEVSGKVVEEVVTKDPFKFIADFKNRFKVAELADRLKSHPDTTTVLDLGSSLKYRKRGHIPGAWWGVRSRLQQARDVIGETEYLALTASDGRLAKLAVPEAAALWPDAEVVALAAGNKGWRHADYDMDPGFDRATTDANDVWYKPYDHDDDDAVEQHMRDYLTWEIALVEQLDRDPTVSFPSFD